MPYGGLPSASKPSGTLLALRPPAGEKPAPIKQPTPTPEAAANEPQVSTNKELSAQNAFFHSLHLGLVPAIWINDEIADPLFQQDNPLALVGVAAKIFVVFPVGVVGGVAGVLLGIGRSALASL